MRSLVFAAIVFTSSIASARALLFILRVDLDKSVFARHASGEAGAFNDSTRFVVQTGRLQYEGQVNDDLKFQARLRFDTVPGPVANRTDNLNNTVDVAFFRHRVGNELFLSVGKVAADILADDGIPATEIYLPSRARTDIFSYLYGTGVKVEQGFGGHWLKLMVFNQSDVTAVDQSEYMFGVVYEGTFAGRSLAPTLSYHRDRLQDAPAAGQTSVVEMLAAGLRYRTGPVTVSADYLRNLRQNMAGIGSASVPAAGQDNDLTTHLLDAAYGWSPRWASKLRYDYSTNKARGPLAAIRTTFHGLSLVTEFTPIAGNELFRYHVAWTRLTTAPAGGASQTNQHFIIGARIVADFLK